MHHYPAPALEAFSRRVLEALGSAPAEAAVVAEHMISANLAGHDSHGIHLLPRYVDNVRAGIAQPNTSVKVIDDEGPILRFDGGQGFGQRVALEATRIAAERARAQGVAIWALKRAMHIGRVGRYGEELVGLGLGGLFFVNVTGHDAFVAPHGGRDARLSTNPLCIAVPGDPPFILDMATSQIAHGKAVVARDKGLTLGPGLALDGRGEETCDPGAYLDDPGALLPAGLHKGYGLALACELLAGVVGGAGILDEHQPNDHVTRNNIFAVTFRPDRFDDPAAQRTAMADVRRFVTASPPRNPAEPVMIPGDPERRARAKRSVEGIPLPQPTVEALLATAGSLGLGGSALQPLAMSRAG
ncbi:MAG TPA: Ldh family oxidoreductase [Kiloniellales bacterium]|nr:Ldh family oxidoreductase [Kiloniellales bacterium]